MNLPFEPVDFLIVGDGLAGCALASRLREVHARATGVEGLRVCDALVMPTVPYAKLNIPVLVIAAKTAATIHAGG
jgi:choline dehydrogenase-like flavoprotein